VKTNGSVQLTVRDTGAGVPDAEHERIFDPFYSTRPDGAGLGSPVREIARRHDGDVELDSSCISGATFILTLPANPGDGCESRDSRGGRRCRHSLQSRTAVALGRVCRPRSGGRRCGGEALADPSVAAALLDLKLPKRDGLAVLAGHAERIEDVPVIVITAYGGSEAAIQA